MDRVHACSLSRALVRCRRTRQTMMANARTCSNIYIYRYIYKHYVRVCALFCHFYFISRELRKNSSILANTYVCMFSSRTSLPNTCAEKFIDQTSHRAKTITLPLVAKHTFTLTT